jgi:hypothetical protein
MALCGLAASAEPLRVSVYATATLATASPWDNRADRGRLKRLGEHELEADCRDPDNPSCLWRRRSAAVVALHAVVGRPTPQSDGGSR